jgi:hypothetical protein
MEAYNTEKELDILNKLTQQEKQERLSHSKGKCLETCIKIVSILLIYID